MTTIAASFLHGGVVYYVAALGYLIRESAKQHGQVCLDCGDTLLVGAVRYGMKTDSGAQHMVSMYDVRTALPIDCPSSDI